MFNAPERSSARRMAHNRSSWTATLFLAAVAVTGCAGQRPITSSVPPAPTPVPTSTPTPTRPSTPTPAPAPRPPTRTTRNRRHAALRLCRVSMSKRAPRPGTASRSTAPRSRRRNFRHEYARRRAPPLPFGSILRVTNLNNGREVEVRVIDRGRPLGIAFSIWRTPRRCRWT